MSVSQDGNGEGIRLRFYGGFFHPIPGGGETRGMEVHFRFAESVTVDGGSTGSDLDRPLTSAVRLDFLAEESLGLPADPLARAVSHILPIDYHGFRKTIAFHGGRVTRRFEPRLLTDKRRELEELRRSRPELEAFRELTGIHGHDEDYLSALSREFFHQVDATDEGLAPWLPGYFVEVSLRPRRVLVNGRLRSEDEAVPGQPQVTLPPGSIISFRASRGSHLPHYPADNPHVLEQPPTI